MRKTLSNDRKNMGDFQDKGFFVQVQCWFSDYIELQFMGFLLPLFIASRDVLKILHMKWYEHVVVQEIYRIRHFDTAFNFKGGFGKLGSVSRRADNPPVKQSGHYF